MRERHDQEPVAADPHEECEEEAGLFSKQTDRADRLRERDTTRNRWRRTKSVTRPGTPHTRKKTERQRGQTKRQRHDQEPVAADQECKEAWQASHQKENRERPWPADEECEEWEEAGHASHQEENRETERRD